MKPFDYRIIHVISGDLWAGAEVQAFNLVTALASYGCNVMVILFNHGILENKLSSCNIPLEVIDEQKNSGFKILLQLNKVFKSYQATIIHSHGFKENILSSIASRPNSNAVLIRTEHGNSEFKVPFWKPHKKLLHTLNYLAGKYFQKAIVSVSEPLAKMLAKKYPAKKIFIIENAINIEQVRDTHKNQDDKIFPSDKIILACVGRLVPLKRQDILIDMMPELLKTYRNIELYIFGDGPERDNLTAQINELQLNDHVRLMGNTDPIYPYLKNVDILLMPSDHEGLPMTILESLALEVAIIAHAVGGIPKVLDNGNNGILVHEHTTRGYLNAVLRIIEDSAGKNEMIKKGLQYLYDHYSIDKQVHEYDKLYIKLLEQQHQSL